MAIRPSTPEIITVNSEALQTQVRDLLPSQNGFGSELQATNVITPIIDLTAAAEGSGLPFQLQTALAFGSQTAFDVTNTTTTIINTTGFYRVFGAGTVRGTNAANNEFSFSLTDGLSTKKIYEVTLAVVNNTNVTSQNFDFIVFLAAGESLSTTSSSAFVFVTGSTRQIATGDGTLVNPSGFPL